MQHGTRQYYSNPIEEVESCDSLHETFGAGRETPTVAFDIDAALADSNLAVVQREGRNSDLSLFTYPVDENARDRSVR